MPGDPEYKVIIRRSQRARHVRLLAKPTGLELVVPSDVGEKQALKFLHQHREWAAQKMAEVQNRHSQHLNRAACQQSFETGSVVPFQGRDVRLIVNRHAGKRININKGDHGSFEISLPASSLTPVDQQVRSALFAWITQWMRKEAVRLADLHNRNTGLGLVPRSIRVKQMTTRWGSCGPHNDINLNWLLAFTPPSVLEYVVVHEICHIRHRNHSSEFWSLVARHLPQWSEERLWLRQKGCKLLTRFAP